jgi:hypothetical protein
MNESFSAARGNENAVLAGFLKEQPSDEPRLIFSGAMPYTGFLELRRSKDYTIKELSLDQWYLDRSKIKKKRASGLGSGGVIKWWQSLDADYTWKGALLDFADAYAIAIDFRSLSEIPEEISQSIEGARASVSTTADSDDPDFQPSDAKALELACDFVERNLHRLWYSSRTRVPLPRILPGPGSGIDIHWKEQGFEMLINVPSPPTLHATFYGDDYGTSVIKGSFNITEAAQFLFTWITERQKCHVAD